MTITTLRLRGILMDMIKHGQLVESCIPDDWEWLHALYFCDGCLALSPQEKEQTKAKEPHICSILQQPIFHGDYHPRLPRPLCCKIERQ
jgi:hypothetical protein